MPRLIAKTRVKYGSKVLTRDRFGVATTEPGTTVAPGEEFEVDDKTAKQMLEDGTAITAADARAEDRKTMTAEAKLREAEEEARKAGLHFTPATIGTAGSDRNIEAHRENQAEEEAAVKEAMKDQPAAKKTTRGKS